MRQFDINDKGLIVDKSLYRVVKERGQYSKLKWLIAHKVYNKTVCKFMFTYNPFAFSSTLERAFDKEYEEFLKKKAKNFGFFKKILYSCKAFLN